jgi:murein DD-endopeptidase MepM/ murein hydrolase activator NlpD
MIRISFNLPTKRRLHIHLVKRRETSIEKPLIPSFKDIKNTRKGNKISRFFRHIFEHKKFKRLLGTNLALMLVATSIYPAGQTLTDFDTAEDTVIQSHIVLTTQKGIRYPVEKVKISQGYKFYHPGIDLDGITGDAVYPIMAGKVEAIDFSRYAYGNAILLNHGNGITTLYAHLSRILVAKDQHVSMDTVIGQVGATGRASGDHLHLEVRDNGRPINPLLVLPQ